MTAQSWLWWNDWTTGFTAGSAHSVATIAGNQHLRRVRVVGNTTYTPFPTNVLGDNDTWIGVVAKFPAVNPGGPSLANAASYTTGWWGRPVKDAVELVYLTGGSTVPSLRHHWHVEFEYPISGNGTAGQLYVGHQAIYIDANHALPDVSFSLTAWGYAT